MLLIAHRGLDNHDHRQNTIAAFKQALYMDYIDGIEFDVRMTKDGKFIICHNPFILENGVHIISIINYKKLKKVLKTSNYELITLEQVLNEINTNKKIIIDIKEEGNRGKKCVKRLIPILNYYQNKNISICSFNDEILTLIEKNNTNYKTGVIVSLIINYSKLNKNKNDFTVVKYSLLDQTHFVKPVYFWTINKKQDYNKIKNKKSSYPLGIITDNAYKFISN